MVESKDGELSMIVSFGTFDFFGGLNTLTRAYVESFDKSDIPVYWVIFGTEKDTLCSGENITFLKLTDSWKYYTDRSFVDKEIVFHVRSIINKLAPKLLFRPLQFSFDPYLSDCNLESIKCAHLVYARLLASFKEKSNIITNQNKGSLKADKIRLGYEKRFYNDKSYIIANSQNTMDALRKYYPHIQEDKIILNPPGAIEDFFKIDPMKGIERKALFFGRLNYQKSIDSLLKSVPDGWQFRILGQGKWEATHFTNLGIQYLGWQGRRRVIDELSQVSFCLFPSIYEPWGLSLNEALAAGRICVAQSGVGGHEEQMIHGQNGFLVDFHSGDFWMEIENIFNMDKDELMRVCENAKNSARRWREHFFNLENFLKKKL